MLPMRASRLLPVLFLAAACGAPAPAVSPVTHASAPANFTQVRDDLYRGGHPTGAQLAYLKSLGVRTIVDLEINDLIEATEADITEEDRAATATGLAVVHAPMSAFEPARSDRFDAQMNDVLTLLGDRTKGPFYVHCKHGQDRTGLVIGLERVVVEKWAPKDAYGEMLHIGFHPMFKGLKHYFEHKTGYDAP
jgi:protein tyrosine/serine phosphatase